MSLTTKIEYTTNPRKCTGCKSKTGPKEAVFGTAVSYGGGNVGSMMWRHVKCALRSHLSAFAGDFSGLDGWATLNAEDKENFHTVLLNIQEGKAATKSAKKKRKSTGNADGTPKAKKSKSSTASSASKEKDASAPKKPASLYILFSSNMRAKIKQDNPDIAPKDIMKEAGRLWKELNELDKAPYVVYRKALMEEYERQAAEYAETGAFTKKEVTKPEVAGLVATAPADGADGDKEEEVVAEKDATEAETDPYAEAEADKEVVDVAVAAKESPVVVEKDDDAAVEEEEKAE